MLTSILGWMGAWMLWSILAAILLIAGILLFRITEALQGMRQEMMLRRMRHVVRQESSRTPEPIRCWRKYRVMFVARKAPLIELQALTIVTDAVNNDDAIASARKVAALDGWTDVNFSECQAL